MDELTRTVERFAWLPVRLSDGGGWVHLAWYRATERWREDETGWSSGAWVRVAAHALTHRSSG